MEILCFFKVLTLIITFYYFFDISQDEMSEGKSDIKQTLVY